MINGSLASLPHSEAVVSSAALSASFLSAGSLGSSAERRHTKRSRRASGGAPPLRSLDVTEKPHDGSEASAVASSRGNDDEKTVDELRSSSSSSSDHSRSSTGAHRDLTARFEQNTHEGADDEDNLESQDESEAAAAASAKAANLQATSTTAPSAASSSYSSTSDKKDNDYKSKGSSASSSVSFPAFSNAVPGELLPLLSPEQLETALRLYVDRDGIYACEVADLLATLPFVPQSSLPPSHRRTKIAGNVNATSSLLDPETWLCAVAAAVKAGQTDVNDMAREDEKAAAKEGASFVKASLPSSACSLPSLSPAVLQEGHEKPLPQPVLEAKHYENSRLDQSSGGVSSSRRDLTAAAPATEKAALSSSSGKALQPQQQQQQRNSHSGEKSPSRATPANRKLAFDDDPVEESCDVSHIQPLASLPELPPRPPSSSLQSFASQPIAFLPSPHAPAPAPAPSKPSTAPLLRRSAEGKPITTNTTTATTVSANASRRPPRSSPLTSKPLYSSVSPETPHLRCDPPLTLASLRSTHNSSLSVASASASASAAAAASTAVAAEAAAGMRALFQQCLRTPLAAATSMLSESDWVVLTEELRRDGHHKLPPQAVLDDVTQTIAVEMRQRKRPGGLNLSDFTRLLHSQMDEVRRDLTAHALSAAATASPEVAAASVEFPLHPNYLVALPAHRSEVSAGSNQNNNNNNNSCSNVHGDRTSLSPFSTKKNAKAGGSEHRWRVLPTWCMALAGLFPVEMSSVCPVPVVRYLRSIGLMDAVLAAVVQRLELELEATPNTAANAAAAASAVAAALPGDAARSSARSGAGLPLTLKPTELHSLAALSSSAVGIPSPVGVSGFVWPPRSNSLVSFSTNNANNNPASNMSGSAWGTGSAGVRPTSSVVVESVSRDGAPWRESEEWRSVERTSTGGPNAPSSVEKRGGDGDGAAASLGNGSSPASAGASASRPRSTVPHYLEERPLDEISASVIARAKARRLMDSLRRNTVPINRYECFARVEHEDEPAQEPLCFVSKAELEQAFGGSGGDDDEDASQDSDAMSDIVRALTYDPAAAALEVKSEKRNSGDEGNDADSHLSPERNHAVYTDQYHRTTVRPPRLPHVPVSALVSNVFSGPTRASAMLRARASLARNNQHSPHGMNGVHGADGGPRGSSASATLGISEVHQRPSPAHAGHNGPLLAPPPPVPGMYRMSGVLLGALSKKREEALVERLSHPIFDPHTTGLRAASAFASHLTSPTKKSTTTVAAASVSAAAAATTGGRGGEVSRAADGPPRAWSAAVAPRRNPSSPLPSQRDDPRAAHHSPSPQKDAQGNESANTSRGRPARTPRRRPAPALPPSPLATTAPHLTRAQIRGFCFFHVPPVLMEDPLSTAAAAAAMTQVLRTHESAAVSGLSDGESADSPDRPYMQTQPYPQPLPRGTRAAMLHPARPRQQRELNHRCRRPAASPPSALRSNESSPTAAAAAATNVVDRGRKTKQLAVHRGSSAAAVAAAARRQPSVRGAVQRAHTAHHGGSAASPSPRWQQQQQRHSAAPETVHRMTSSTKSRKSLGTADHDSSTAAARRHDASTLDDTREAPVRSPPPAPMSLYERRLLRRLQRAYTAEKAEV